ncbi:MAG: hypothetical protein K9W44_04020 [Candidatus Lokiarchaeota archaeon]|nr:hypothetical protein [Candidatus Harpocratesius repetitus]
MINATVIPGFFDVNKNSSLEEWINYISEYCIYIYVSDEYYDLILSKIYEDNPDHYSAFYSRINFNLIRFIKKKKYSTELKPCSINLPEDDDKFLIFLHGFLLEFINEPFTILLTYSQSSPTKLICTNSCSLKNQCANLEIISEIKSLQKLLINFWKKIVKKEMNQFPRSKKGKTEKIEFYCRILKYFLDENLIQYKYLTNIEAFCDEHIKKEMEKNKIVDKHRVDLVTIHSNKEVIFIEAKSNSKFKSLKEKIKCTFDFIEKLKNWTNNPLKAIGIIHKDHFIPKRTHICINKKLYQKLSNRQKKIVKVKGIPLHMFKEKELRKS